jgi:hypothetical protein
MGQIQLSSDNPIPNPKLKFSYQQWLSPQRPPENASESDKAPADVQQREPMKGEGRRL